MINPKQCMVGNYFQDSLSGEKLILDEITRNDANDLVLGLVVIDRDKYPLSNGWQAVPIPLTRELLFLCGFELQKGLLAHRYFKKDDLELERSAEGFLRIMVTQFCTFRFETEYKFLHEIQNLYFSLTGKELEVPL
jgi:hypothetical protein